MPDQAPNSSRTLDSTGAARLRKSASSDAFNPPIWRSKDCKFERKFPHIKVANLSRKDYSQGKPKQILCAMFRGIIMGRALFSLLTN